MRERPQNGRPPSGPRRRPEGDGEAALERRLGTALARARAALLWERVWPAALWPLGVAGLFLAVSWFGLWLVLPAFARFGLLAAFALALLVALVPLARLRWPGDGEAIRRVERASGLDHRPIATLADRMAAPGDPGAEGLWRAHRRHLAARLGSLSAGLPSPRLDRRDPFALRVALALVVLVAFVHAGADRERRVLAAFAGAVSAPGAQARFDAWVSPPGYTGRAPIFLTRESAIPGRAIAVPEGSVLVARAGGGAPVVAERVDGDGVAEPLERMADDGEPMADEGGDAGPFAGDDAPASGGTDTDIEREAPQASEFRARLTQDAHVRVRVGEAERGAWRFAVRPDAPPEIAFADPPAQARSGALRLGYTFSDDYGIAGAEARIEPVPAEGASGIAPPEGEPRPLYRAPDVPLDLPGRAPREGGDETYRDLTDHPWAGAEVALTLAARDEADQWGTSQTRRLALPARDFSEPLARAVVELRRELAMDARRADLVSRALDALTLEPEERIDDVPVYLGLRSAYWRLTKARDEDTLRSVVDQLWEVALAIEDGDLSLAQRRLREAQEALRRALDENASDAEIAEAMDELRQAMNDFLQEMMANAALDPDAEMPPMPEGQMLEGADLERMLDQIEDLARSGSREAARDMLSQLQQMMENLQAGRMPQGQSAMSEAMEAIGEMIQEQQRLMNETYGMDGGREAQPNMPSPMPGMPPPFGQPPFGQPSPGARPLPGGGSEDMAEALGGLREGQGDLRRRLEEMLGGMGQGGEAMAEALGQAGENMRQAEGALGEGAAGQAVQSQGEALESLRQGAQALSEQMAGQGAGQGAADGSGSRDPLGRPRRTQGPDYGDSVRVPDEIEIQRAREILRELRDRLSDPARPRLERDYLERLMDRF